MEVKTFTPTDMYLVERIGNEGVLYDFLVVDVTPSKTILKVDCNGTISWWYVKDVFATFKFIEKIN